MTKSLHNNIVRSNRAYKMYLSNRTFYNAMKIYNANIQIYYLLQDYIQMEDCSMPLDELIKYIFHLEDWFLLFENNAEDITDVQATFIFESFEDSISYPDYFKIENE